jgi:hypothetical protein
MQQHEATTERRVAPHRRVLSRAMPRRLPARLGSSCGKAAAPPGHVRRSKAFPRREISAADHVVRPHACPRDLEQGLRDAMHRGFFHERLDVESNRSWGSVDSSTMRRTMISCACLMCWVIVGVFPKSVVAHQDCGEHDQDGAAVEDVGDHAALLLRIAWEHDGFLSSQRSTLLRFG